LTHAILAREHLPTLVGFAASNVLIALDYDGTLAPIAPTPGRARMRAETRRLLADVARLYPCIVISGRALDDLGRRLEGIPLWFLFGNHGIEPAGPRATHTATIREWVKRLREQMPEDLGITIEDKKHSLTIHYRHARDKHRARAAIDEALDALPEARALGGAEAVSVLPPGSADKGIALQQARRRFACDTAIYVGDDDTDEIAFGSDGVGRLLAIRIGGAKTSHARYHLRSQAEMDALLEVLVEARRHDRGDGAGRKASRIPR
jgi:trehalose 6-phosphate phosphatase